MQFTTAFRLPLTSRHQHFRDPSSRYISSGTSGVHRFPKFKRPLQASRRPKYRIPVLISLVPQQSQDMWYLDLGFPTRVRYASWIVLPRSSDHMKNGCRWTGDFNASYAPSQIFGTWVCPEQRILVAISSRKAKICGLWGQASKIGCPRRLEWPYQIPVSWWSLSKQ